MSGDDDRAARDAADSRFIVERLQALLTERHDAKAAEDAYRRAILDLLRSGAVGPEKLRMTAGELERLWWPEAHKKRRRRDREQACGRLTT
jgi:hypothetical protein